MEKEAMISIENLNKQFKNQLVLNNMGISMELLEEMVLEKQFY